MNIDINRNGKPDSEDDLIWKAFSTLYFRGYPTREQFDNNSYPFEDLYFHKAKLTLVSNIEPLDKRWSTSHLPLSLLPPMRPSILA